MDIVTILSGGMDSATLAYQYHQQGAVQRFITFDYGQRHRREIDAARAIAQQLSAPHDVVDLHALGGLFKGSALTDAVPVPHGHYAAENMKVTVVPNRNAIMLAIAYGVAVAEGAQAVAYAAHAGDHFIYPDCRPVFVKALEDAFQRGTDANVEVYAPFIDMTKGEIARLGVALGVPYELTWTCYEGGEYPCGRCGSCVERAEAFEFAGVPDPLVI